MNAPDPWAVPTPSADRVDIFERGIYTRQDMEREESSDADR